MRGRKRPMDERARAVGIAVVAGVSEAAEQTGIPQRSIYEWLDDPEFAELRKRTKEQVADEWWAGIQIGFRAVIEAFKGDDSIQQKATAAAILADKRALLIGEPTERYETRDLSGVLDDHELELLRRAIHAATEPAEEAAVAGAGEGQPTPA